MHVFDMCPHMNEVLMLHNHLYSTTMEIFLIYFFILNGLITQKLNKSRSLLTIMADVHERKSLCKLQCMHILFILSKNSLCFYAIQDFTI